MKIHITTLAGTQLTLDNVQPVDSIESLKLKINAAWGAPIDQQRLRYRGKNLETFAANHSNSDDNATQPCTTLAFYKIPNDATLTLLLQTTKMERTRHEELKPVPFAPGDNNNNESDSPPSSPSLLVQATLMDISAPEADVDAPGTWLGFSRRRCIYYGGVIMIVVAVACGLTLGLRSGGQADMALPPTLAPSAAPTPENTRTNTFTFPPTSEGTMIVGGAGDDAGVPMIADALPPPGMTMAPTSATTLEGTQAPQMDDDMGGAGLDIGAFIITDAPTITLVPELDGGTLPPAMENDAASSQTTALIVMVVLVPLLLMFGGYYFVWYRPRNGKHKEEEPLPIHIPSNDGKTTTPNKKLSSRPLQVYNHEKDDIENKPGGHGKHNKKEDNEQLLGVSVHWLKYGFLKEVKDAGHSEQSTIYDLEDLSKPDQPGVIRQKGLAVRCPLDGQMGAAYVHCLGKDPDMVGPSTVMLSYSWGYSIGDIVDTLWEYCSSRKLSPKQTYIWICCLCVNEHRVADNLRQGKEMPFYHFRDIFHSRVTNIGHLLAMMSPWYQPEYITRVWCIFELYAASLNKTKKNGDNSNIQVTIIMPPKQTLEMARTFGLKGTQAIDQLYQTMGNTKVEEAMASKEEDKANILKMVEQGPGFRALNIRVNDLLRQWVKQSTLGVVGMLVQDRNTIKDNDTIHNDRSVAGGPPSSLLASSSNLKLSDREFADFVSNVGVLFGENGEQNRALEYQQLALTTYTSIGDVDGAASSYSSIGSVLQNQGDLEGALENYRKALSLQEDSTTSSATAAATGMNDERKTLLNRKRAMTLKNIASVLLAQGDCPGALEQIRKAFTILSSSKDTAKCTETASTLAVEGLVYFEQGDYERASECTREALAIRERLLGMYHPDTASSYHQYGRILNEMSNNDEDDLALEYFQQALAIREVVLGSDHPDTLSSMETIAKRVGELERTAAESKTTQQHMGIGFGAAPATVQVY